MFILYWFSLFAKFPVHVQIIADIAAGLQTCQLPGIVWCKWWGGTCLPFMQGAPVRLPRNLTTQFWVRHSSATGRYLRPQNARLEKWKWFLSCLSVCIWKENISNNYFAADLLIFPSISWEQLYLVDVLDNESVFAFFAV